MDKYTQVQGYNGLVRARSGAIINIDSKSIAQARSRKKVWKEQQAEIESLRNDVAMMKQMLQQIIEDK
jgi:hypothetical protein